MFLCDIKESGQDSDGALCFDEQGMVDSVCARSPFINCKPSTETDHQRTLLKKQTS
jgi:hypothetical protein